MATRQTTTTRRKTTKAKAGTATAKAPATLKPKAESLPNPTVTLKKRDLIERAVAESGLKRRDVKAVTEAVLKIMGDAVDRGEGLALEPFGKLRLARVAEGTVSRTFTAKLRRKMPGLAKAAE